LDANYPTPSFCFSAARHCQSRKAASKFDDRTPFMHDAQFRAGEKQKGEGTRGGVFYKQATPTGFVQIPLSWLYGDLEPGNRTGSLEGSAGLWFNSFSSCSSRCFNSANHCN
jgi:hypothetical protein